LADDKLDFIKKELLKSGFPLEMEVSSILRKRNYEVFKSVYFFDDDEQKAREFDIFASLPLYEDSSIEYDLDTDWYFNPFVAIECKKSAVYSWVFFRSEPIVGHLDIGHSIDVLTEKVGYLKSVCGQLLTKSFLSHYTNEEANIVSEHQQVKYAKLPKNGRVERPVKDSIFDAISKIIKFMNYNFQTLNKFYRADPTRNDVIFYFPIIVFDGPLYEVSYEKSLEVKASKHVIYETSYFSNLTKSLVPAYIDIVRKDAFEEVLSIIEKEAINCRNYLRTPEAQERLSKILNTVKE
jgi:hypothetical protein